MNLQQKMQYIADIMQDVPQYRHLEGDDRLKAMFAKYIDFAEQCPALYMGLVNERLEPEQLQYILHMSGNVEAGNVSFNDASVVVGQKLYKDYVEPVIGPDVPVEQRQPPPPSTTSSQHPQQPHHL